MFMNVVRFIRVLLLGGVVGLVAGYRLSSWHELAFEWHSLDDPAGHAFFENYDLVARLSQADIRSELRLDRPTETLERRREALNLILDAAQKGRPQVSNPAVLTLIDVETGITYTRLAMLEEAAGNLPASQTWMQKAQASLKQAGWKDCSEGHLKDVVQALHKRNSCECDQH
jgi:hypothetical protein